MPHSQVVAAIQKINAINETRTLVAADPLEDPHPAQVGANAPNSWIPAPPNKHTHIYMCVCVCVYVYVYVYVCVYVYPHVYLYVYVYVYM